MRLLMIALMAGSATSASAVAVQNAPIVKGTQLPGSAECPRTAGYYAYQDGKALKPQKLNALPPANAYIAILRTNGRCEVPVIVKYNIGGH